MKSNAALAVLWWSRTMMALVLGVLGVLVGSLEPPPRSYLPPLRRDEQHYFSPPDYLPPKVPPLALELELEYAPPSVSSAALHQPPLDLFGAQRRGFSFSSTVADGGGAGIPVKAGKQASIAAAAAAAAAAGPFAEPLSPFSPLLGAKKKSQLYLPPHRAQVTPGYQQQPHASPTTAPPPVPPVPPPAKYQFGYSVSDDYGNEYGHEESRNGDSAHGMFSVLLPDGRKQIVRYRADAKGYHPTITYEPAKRRAPISSTLSGPY